MPSLSDPRARRDAREAAAAAAAAAAAPPAPAAAPALSPEDQVAFDSWIQQVQNAGGAEALFAPENVRGASERAIAEAQAARAQEAQVNATNARYGTDLSWLDPSFQYSPELLGQSAGSQAYADPAAIASQNAAMTQAQQFANTNLQFQSPAAQQALMQQWAGIQGGQGAPSFMGNAQQQQILAQLQGIQAPRFSGDADQRQVLDAALGFMNNSGPGSLQFDTSGRQAEQYGNLQGIIAGGGATAIEMADRARQRADSEAWLRGQREADMADYAERGLTGSGMELLALSSDRQAAAGRNSLADLETAKALEERRLGAINSAAGLATNMRGQTIDEQGLLSNRATTGLNVAGSVTNSMRDANIREQLGLNQALQSQAIGAANIAGQMRTQDYNERSYLDERTLNALEQQTRLTDSMRTQQANEQIGQRNAQQNALSTWANTANSMRDASAQESQYRATSADAFSRYNQDAINSAAQTNTQHLQTAYRDMMNNRQQWEITQNNNNTQLALGLLNYDQRENQAGFNQGTNVGTQTANQFNNGQQNYNGTLTGTGQQANANTSAAQQAYNALYPLMGQVGAEWINTVVGGAINQGSMPSGGGNVNIPSSQTPGSYTMPTGASNPYGVGVGGGRAASGQNPYGVSAGGTRTGGGTSGVNLGNFGGQLSTQQFLPQNFDWEKFNQGLGYTNGGS